MANRNGNHKKTQFEGNTLSFLRISGVLLFGTGIMLLLCFAGVFHGNFFKIMLDFLYGLGGAGAVGIPVFCSAGGILLICISRQRTRIRYFLIVLIFFLAGLALLNASSHIDGTPFMDTLADFNQSTGIEHKDGFAEMLSAAKKYSSYYKSFGGALGILLAYPLWYYLNNTMATVLLIVAMLLLVLLFIAVLPQKKKNQLENVNNPESMIQHRASKPSLFSRAFEKLNHLGEKNKSQNDSQGSIYPLNAPINRPVYAQPVMQQNAVMQPMPASYYQPVQMMPQMYGTPAQQLMFSQPAGVYATNQGQWMYMPNANYPNQMIAVPNRPFPSSMTPMPDYNYPAAENNAAEAVYETNPEEPFRSKNIEDTGYEEPDESDDGDSQQSIYGAALSSNDSFMQEQALEEEKINESRRHAIEKLSRKGKLKTTEQNKAPNGQIWETNSTDDRPEGSGAFSTQFASSETTWYDEMKQAPGESEGGFASFAPQVQQFQSFVTPPEEYSEPSVPEETDSVYRQLEVPQHETKILPEKPETPSRSVLPIPTPSFSPQKTGENQESVFRSETRAMEHFHVDTDGYEKPSIEFLQKPKAFYEDYSAEDAERSRRLEEMFKGFHIAVKVQNVTHGPSVSRFELNLMQPGVNLTQITNKTTNIAMVLETNGAVNIQEHIPGTSMFGIYVPNSVRRSVTLREILESHEMQSSKSPTAVALGYDIMGRSVVCNLSEMPHLMVAGTTGSGKSVCMNGMIVSLLYRTTPKQVRLILIDPKMVEFSMYDKIPHLLIPVVTDPQKASGALMWLVGEMDDRYAIFQSVGVKNIDQYNKLLPPDQDPMPIIVIFIDELADLMMTCQKDVEASIVRLGQKARAAGIHMVLATQRPEAKIVTGAITSNISSRIAMKVSSALDSRIILGENGAEALLGHGDLIYRCTAREPVRLQGCYVSDEEIKTIVDFLSRNGTAEYNSDLMESMESAALSSAMQENDIDSKLDDRIEEAAELVLNAGQASASFLQRRMGIGYPKAGKLIDDLERIGIIGMSTGNKPREVIMTREEYEENKKFLLSGRG